MPGINGTPSPTSSRPTTPTPVLPTSHTSGGSAGRRASGDHPSESRITPQDMPGTLQRTNTSSSRAGRANVPARTPATTHGIEVEGPDTLALQPLGPNTSTSATTGQPETDEARDRRQAQETGHADLVAYGRNATPGSRHAIGQAAVALGIGAGGTFGAADSAFREGGAKLVGLANHIQELLQNAEKNPDIRNLVAGKVAQYATGWATGAALAGVGSLATQTVIAPAVLGVLQSLSGKKSAFKPVEAEHVVPDPDPSKYPTSAALETAVARVQVQRAEIREIQSRFAIDGRVGIGAGVAMFDLGHGTRVGVSHHTDASPSVGASTGYGTAASGGAGFATAALLASGQAMTMYRLDSGAQVHLFKAATQDVSLANIAGNVAGNVSAAWKQFNPNDLAGTDLALHILKQWGLRASGVAAATLPAVATTASAVAADAAIGEGHDHAKAAIEALTTMAAFTAAVPIWFTALPKIIGRQAVDPRRGTGEGDN